MVDYCGLNAVTEADSYPVPLMSEALEKLQGSQVFSLFHASSAYNCIQVTEEAKPWDFEAKNAGTTYSCFISELIEKMKSDHI